MTKYLMYRMHLRRTQVCIVYGFKNTSETVTDYVKFTFFGENFTLNGHIKNYLIGT